jgi:hypothetical protein
MGCHEDAYKWFDLICQRIQQQRSTIQSKQLELHFQQQATEEYANMQGGTHARTQWQEPTMRVFNELSNSAAVYIDSILLTNCMLKELCNYVV